ncbi:MAG TPA: aldo/keto reductase [Humibacter sp.]|nr:aldo/keto reductase [Humibacter sp.]
MSIPFGPLSYGVAPLGNLYREVSDEQAHDALQAAWDAGIRYFDTAPHYGLGLSERRLGAFLRGKPRDEFTVSTKVGRLLVPNPDDDGSGDLDRVFKVPGDLMRRFDTTEAGIRRSLDESLQRMGLDRVDVVYLHDPDVYDLDRGLREGLPALAALRDEGLVREVGVGTNNTAAAARAVREGDLDLVLIAGRYTLLEQPALDELFPVCAERGVSVVSAAPFNSGLLATNEPPTDARYDYVSAPRAVLDRVRELAGVCASFGVELPAAALQFPGRNPVVATTLVGMASADEVRQNVQRIDATIPDSLWEALD